MDELAKYFCTEQRIFVAAFGGKRLIFSICTSMRPQPDKTNKQNYNTNLQKTQHYEKTILVTNRSTAVHRNGGIGGDREWLLGIIEKTYRAAHTITAQIDL